MEQAREAASAVSDFFAGNPFSSAVGQKIERATDGTLASENWALNMEICDMINMMEEGPRDGLRAIRKRLQTQMGKNHTSVLYTLTVLETCVKNCDRRFHQLVTQKDFVNELVRLIGPKYDPPQVVQEKVLSLIQLVMQKDFVNELVRLIGPKYDPPQVVQEKVLSLIQTWADAFRGAAELRGVCDVYDELKAKGVEFPPTDMDAMAPIFTPLPVR